VDRPLSVTPSFSAVGFFLPFPLRPLRVFLLPPFSLFRLLSRSRYFRRTLVSQVSLFFNSLFHVFCPPFFSSFYLFPTCRSQDSIPRVAASDIFSPDSNPPPPPTSCFSMNTSPADLAFLNPYMNCTFRPPWSSPPLLVTLPPIRYTNNKLRLFFIR